MDATYSLRFSFEHTDSTLELVFSGAGLQDLEDESWGLDNFRIVLMGGKPGKTIYLPLLRR